ncbi:ATP-binding protein [Streptomyces lydicus]|uniref:ATP-binding protein n=1 Tax=Streptomyces lydicus TaxID=47763 RepID=UPI0033E88B2A
MQHQQPHPNREANVMTDLTGKQLLAALAVDDGIERASVEIESASSTVSDARRFVRKQLGTWGFSDGDELIDRVVLAVSELVTNAVLHARTQSSAESELIGLSLTFKRECALGVLVTDNSDAPPLLTARPSVSTDHGRGLAIVNSIADGWTAVPRQGRNGEEGKGVWAFFQCAQAAGVAPHLS